MPALVRDQRGTAAVEFALVSPVLFLLVAGAIDTCRLISQTMQVRAAAQAGADYALNKGWNQAGVTNAVTSATPLTVTPTAVSAAGCASGMTISPPTAALCPAGGVPGNYVTVTAQADFAPLVPWNGVALPSKLNANAVVRLP